VAEALAPQHRFIAYDLRGRGGSDKPERDYNMAAHNRDVLGVLDHFEVERAVVMGHSLGAHIAVRFAARHPDRVAKLVLFDGGLDVRPEVLDSIGPSIARLGVEFPSLDAFVGLLHRTRLWVWHHQIRVPTLLLRAPDGLLRDDDCLMTQEEAEAMAHAIPDCRLAVIAKTNHYTILLGDNAVALDAIRAHLKN
jgi:pimeloyl-ACP methyl ester carboxylesterase